MSTGFYLVLINEMMAYPEEQLLTEMQHYIAEV